MTSHSDIRKAAEMALKHLETVSDWDTTYPIGKAKEALRQALANEFNPDWNQVEALQESLREHMAEIQTLRQALSKPEQEPVAWKHNFIDGNVITHKPADIGRNPERWTALYSEPKPCPTCEALARTVMMDQTSHDTAPPKREWVGLSDEDKDELLNLDNWTDIVEAVEAKLKEKNT